MKPTKELWMEGFSATGQSQKAHCLGTYEGETLMDAYLNYVKEKYGDNPDLNVSLTKPSIWGCDIYDNEADARKSFG